MNMGSSIQINKTGLFFLIFVVGLIIFFYHTSSSTSSARDEKISFEPPDGKVVSLKELLSAAIDAAVRGGNEVRQVRDAASLHELSKGETKEGANDPVTDGDYKSHIVMYYSLKKSFPSIKIVSEEHDSKIDPATIEPAERKLREIDDNISSDEIVYSKDITVWIDPLDATQEYTEDLRQYVTTMVGVAVKGVPVLGVVHSPFIPITYWGWVGHGLSANLKTIKKGSAAELVPSSSPRIIVSRSHKGTVAEVALQAFGDKTIQNTGGDSGQSGCVCAHDGHQEVGSVRGPRHPQCHGRHTHHPQPRQQHNLVRRQHSIPQQQWFARHHQGS
ncbi:Golgi-resident adenosine 3',5'-bisphosphate 3'-phosphatase-like isoform X2 [Hyalella azteca]|uniref:inositol-phosphate phosphatase n=1 Tax=Hyalella azteca TaxID=294128 RepID=A0A8B7NX52_HYAAZ|nr:Golgi-resident adenosine 3',5'-bisphosphate 3'-phosphatase-like isoform X2 [Hyalella azteca]